MLLTPLRRFEVTVAATATVAVPVKATAAIHLNAVKCSQFLHPKDRTAPRLDPFLHPGQLSQQLSLNYVTKYGCSLLRLLHKKRVAGPRNLGSASSELFCFLIYFPADLPPCPPPRRDGQHGRRGEEKATATVQFPPAPAPPLPLFFGGAFGAAFPPPFPPTDDGQRLELTEFTSLSYASISFA